MTQLLSWQQSERKEKIARLLYLQNLEVQEKTRLEQKLEQIKQEEKKRVEELLKAQAIEQQKKTKVEQKLIEQKNALEKQLADKKKQDTQPPKPPQAPKPPPAPPSKQKEKSEECCICLDEKSDAKAIPCKHCKKGSSRICVACLTEIAKKSNKCPTCNKDTLETK